MYQSETMDAVRDAAQILTREGKVLTIGNPEFPLAVFADTYKAEIEPTNSPLPDEEIVAVEEHFDGINQDTTPSEDDTRESIVSNLYTAVAKVQFNTTNVIIPAIGAMHEQYANLSSLSSQPEYSVKPWRYLAPHNSAILVNHVNTRYANVQPKDNYRSYDLEAVGAESIIEMLAVNNPHLDQEEVTEWALQVGSARLLEVWNSLFNTGGTVIPSGLSYLTSSSAPFNVDDILTAYLLCGHYIDNPVAVPGVSVDLDDWEHTLKLLHEMFGFYLMRAYLRRAEYREAGMIILQNDALDPVATRRAIVITNGDVFDPWLVAGGDIQAILGACVSNSGITDVRHLDAKADAFVARWHAVYPLIKQAAIDYSDRQRNSNIVSAFREVSKAEPLKDLYTRETEAKLVDALRYIRRDEYENPYKVFSTLICRVYFPESTYIEYLDAIDSLGNEFPNASVRELSTQGMISLLGIFMAKQVTVEPFLPTIDESEEAGESTQSGLLAVIDDEALGEDGIQPEGLVDDQATGELGDEVTDTSAIADTTETDELDFGSDDEEDEVDPYAEFDDTEETDTSVDETEEVEETETETEESSDDVEEEQSETEVEETAEDEEDETPLN